jgi:hypothetical protein
VELGRGDVYHPAAGVVVMAMDTLSAWLRRRYIGGNVVPLFKAE